MNNISESAVFLKQPVFDTHKHTATAFLLLSPAKTNQCVLNSHLVCMNRHAQVGPLGKEKHCTHAEPQIAREAGDNEILLLGRHQ